MAVDIKKVGNLLSKGLISQVAPDVAKGAIVEIFRGWKLDVKKTTAWVQENRSLWDSMGAEHQNQLKLLVQKVGSIDWLGAEWAIKALKGDFPAVASLFLGWPKAHHWLERQLEIIKKQVRQQMT